jgi:hypothetical protein
MGEYIGYMAFGFGDEREGELIPFTDERDKALGPFANRLEEFLHDDDALSAKDYKRKWGFRKGSFKALVMFDKLVTECGALVDHPDYQRTLNLMITKDLLELQPKPGRN